VPDKATQALRQIHLDFHTSPAIPDVAAQFDARAFAAEMKRAHVNSVTCFAKCHHGHLYYNTSRSERHPGLEPGLDLLHEQVEALQREGIRAPIYISVLCDEYAANAHPEWVVRDAEGKPVGPPPLSPGWQILDMSSPYRQYLAEQTREVLAWFKPVDGLFFDMCWDQPSVGKWAVERMLEAGLDPKNAADRARHARHVSRTYMRELHAMVKESSPNASVFFNCRPLWNIEEEIEFFEQIEIEALPTGGWGYLYFPTHVRHVRTLGKPYLGMTSRFHKSWGDFGGLKPCAALEYETSQMIAHGAACSIGDQLHPRGTLDPPAYELIGRIYQRVKDREPWLIGAEPVTQIGLLQLSGAGPSPSEQGAVRMLTQLRHQFDIVNWRSPLEKYELLILPDAVVLDDRTASRVNDYLAKGGAVLATGTSGLSPDASRLLLPELGVEPLGFSPFTATYIRFDPQLSREIPPTDHVVYDRGVRVRASADTTVLAHVVEPYFERSWQHFCSHAQTPPATLTDYAAVTQRGRAGYVSFPVFASFANHGSYNYRLLIKNLIERLLPNPLIRVDGPTSLEATLTRQADRIIVHLLHYVPERRTGSLDLVEDIVPLFDVPISLRRDSRPARVYLAPDGVQLPFEFANGRVDLRVPEIRGHQMIVIE
jgi:hypothetical protein